MSEKNIITNPWRRFFARGIDIVLIQLLLVFYGIAETEPGLGFWFFTIVISLMYEPLCYHFCGATLGKAVLGIRIVGENSEKLSLGAIFKRTLGVWFYGMGLYLPVVCQIANLYYLIKYDDFKGITTWDKIVSSYVVYKKNLRTQDSAVIKNKEEEVTEDIPIVFLSKEIKDEEGKRNEDKKLSHKTDDSKKLIFIVLGVICIVIVFFIALGAFVNYSEEIKNKAAEEEYSRKIQIEKQREIDRQKKISDCLNDVDIKYNASWRNNCATVYENCVNYKSKYYFASGVNCEMYNPKNPSGCSLPKEQANTLNDIKESGKRECLQRYPAY